MKKVFGLIIVLAVLAVFLSGCTDNPAPNSVPNTDDSEVTPEGIQNVVNSNNQFALELYSEFKEENDNLFFSPYSISTALAMTYEGARGETAEEMQSVLHFPQDDVARRSSFAKLYNQLNKSDKKYELSAANALWAQENYSFLDSYFDMILNYYGANVTNLDFSTKTEESRVTINNWVEGQTNDKIKDLIPEGAITRDTRLVLTNAIYFKGTWLEQFDEKNTSEQNFRVSAGQTVKVPMMSLTSKETKFNYAETDELQIIELPYDGEELSMFVLLPKGDDLESLEESLGAEKLSEWRNLLRKQEVKLYLPKFKLETKYFMNETLEEMGMPTAFSNMADFSGMTGSKDLFISYVIHQAFVEVNEEGTEAAAATAVIMEKLSASIEQPIIFRADHPFIFIIQENETGSILFLGRVSDPSIQN
ncbi:MAG: serpin family protein [Candidatus Diapherotrites archaeon]